VKLSTEEGEYLESRTDDRHSEDRYRNSAKSHPYNTRREHDRSPRESRSYNHSTRPRSRSPINDDRIRHRDQERTRHRSPSIIQNNLNRKNEKKCTEYGSDSDFSSDSD
jgi:hypothetical protein